MGTVDHPGHYNQVPGIECIEVVENFNFNFGNAIKYLWRTDGKGDPIENLEKARWYIDRELRRRGEIPVPPFEGGTWTFHKVTDKETTA